jgi:hypothetical protein
MNHEWEIRIGNWEMGNGPMGNWEKSIILGVGCTDSLSWSINILRFIPLCNYGSHLIAAHKAPFLPFIGNKGIEVFFNYSLCMECSAVPSQAIVVRLRRSLEKKGGAQYK